MRAPTRPALRAAVPAAPAGPAVAVSLVVAGTGMGAVLLTSVGLLPLFGQPELTAAGWRQVAADLGPGVVESLRLALASTALAVVMGLLLALVLLDAAVLAPRRAALLRSALVAVLLVPHLVGASAMGLLLEDRGVAARTLGSGLGTGLGIGPGDWPALVAGDVPTAVVLTFAWKESAFIALVVVAALAPGHSARRDAARSLGAGTVAWWRWGVAPAALPSALAGGLVAMVFTLGNYEVAWLLGRAAPEPLPVLSVRLFRSLDLVDRPAAAAAVLTTAGLALTAVALTLLLLPRLVGPLLGHLHTSPAPRGRR